jgi:hypothetical protein
METMSRISFHQYQNNSVHYPISNGQVYIDLHSSRNNNSSNRDPHSPFLVSNQFNSNINVNQNQPISRTVNPINVQPYPNRQMSNDLPTYEEALSKV